MDTLPLTAIEPIAIDWARNIHRRWSLMVARDLFGDVRIKIDWGRIGR